MIRLEGIISTIVLHKAERSTVLAKGILAGQISRTRGHIYGHITCKSMISQASQLVIKVKNTDFFLKNTHLAAPT